MSKTSSVDGDKKPTTIADLLSLPDNWDNEGASKVSAITAGTALRLLAIAEDVMSSYYALDISANPNGTVATEWRSDHGLVYLEVGRSKFSVLAVNNRTHKTYGIWNISRVSKKFVRNVLAESKAFLDGDST